MPRDVYKQLAVKMRGGAAEDAEVINPAAPFDVARRFLATRYHSNGCRTLHRHHGAYFLWNGTSYPQVDDATIRAELYEFLDGCVAPAKETDAPMQPVKPNRNLINNVTDALDAATQLDSAITEPAWLGEGDAPRPDAAEIIACQNLLLHLPTLDQFFHTAAFFSHSALAFAFDLNAGAPREWIKFLHELWPDDPQAISTLQEMFGYCLVSDTSQQKLFMVVGPKRSGKGTIARVLTRLIGITNVVAPTLASLSMNFGLAPLIGKRVAIIGDARLGGRIDQHAIAERLLSISGEDTITVDRKYLPAWTGRLSTRFVIISNELPKLTDASGALVSRFVTLILQNSFYGREDHGLFARLSSEMPGILNWAIAGWRRLSTRGHFVPPASSADAMQELEDLMSPISAFVRERCIVAPDKAVLASRLFEEWAGWCKAHGRDHTGTTASFGRDLRTVVPGLKTTQLRGGDGRNRHYEGVGLR